MAESTLEAGLTSHAAAVPVTGHSDLETDHLQELLEDNKYDPAHCRFLEVMRQHTSYAFLMCRAELALAGSSAGRQSWLQPAFNSSSGTVQIYGWMERYFGQPEFLKRVTNARAQAAVQRGQQELTVQPAEPHELPEPQVADPGWWTVDQIDSIEQVSAAAQLVKAAGCLVPVAGWLQMTAWLAAKYLGGCVS